MHSEPHSRKFTGISRLYGEHKLARLANSHVTVIGLGGVGSWAAEALVRSGVGLLHLIDLDHIAESNINRQLHASESTLGMAKTAAMAQRLLDINPAAKIELTEDFISTDNQAELINPDTQFVIDCIDSFRTKAALIYYCKRNKVRIITTGGAGGRSDPGRISRCDLSRSEGDSLLAKCRKELRQVFGFPKNPARRFDIPCIYSGEQPTFPDADGGICVDKKQSAAATGLSCSTGLGSCVTVTASFGMAAAAHVINKL